MGIFKRKEPQTITHQVFSLPEEAGGVEGMRVKNEKFSTPFMEVGDANLTLPYINNNYHDAGGWVRFGSDNLFPQLTNQMYYTSPLNGSIIDYKTNAVSGGGYVLTPKIDTPEERAKVFAFERKIKLKQNRFLITRDLIQHYSAYFEVFFNSEKQFIKAVRISPEKIRKSKGKKRYFICEDWSRRVGIRSLERYSGKIEPDKSYIYEKSIESVGQDEYSIPTYSSAFNWCYLDGEMSYLHKSNIRNSIFPSFALLFPKKPGSETEKNELRKTIEGAKGAPNAGRVFALFANNADQIPKIESIPVNNNDKLFEQTDERIDAQICKAHTIDPLLMGIRVSGKLGSGNDIQQAYVIFEKNVVKPMREMVEECFNELMQIAGVKAWFELRNFQIVNEEIIEKEDDANMIYEQLSKLSPEVKAKVMENLTVNEIRAMVGASKVKGGDKFNGSQTANKPDNTEMI